MAYKSKGKVSMWLNTLASDLDLVLNDICHGNFPYSGVGPPRLGAGPPRASAPRATRPYQQLGEDPVLEQYITSAADDDEFSADRSESDLSSDGEFFSLDESSDGAVAGSDVDSPTPFFPASSPSDTSTPGPPRPLSPPITNIPLEERLVRTHPIWYLPNIQRRECTQLLCDRDEGIFLVRQASERNKMVLSIRTGPKPNIEHFLIESTASNGLKLKGGYRTFSDITKLITHHTQDRDGLPGLLTLPKVIMQAQSQQEISSLAMLGQDFWTSAISRAPTVMRTVFHTTIPSYTAKQPLSPTKVPRTTCKPAHSSETQQGAAQLAHNSQNGVQNAASANSRGETMMQSRWPVVSSVTSFSSQSRQKSSSFAALTQSSKSKAPPRNLSNDALLRSSSNHYSPYRSDQDGALTQSKEYNSSSLTNHSRETSAFQTPPIIAQEMSTNQSIHNGAENSDKLSDYEDADGPFFFRPIVQSEAESIAGDSSRGTPKHRKVGSFNMVNGVKNSVQNPGFDNRSVSRSDFIDADFFVDMDKEKTRRRLTSTEHVEETKTEVVKRMVPTRLKKSQPCVFTFNVLPSTPTDTMVSPPVPAKSTISIPLSPHHKATCRSTASSQYSSPAYIEPYDSLVGKVEGASQTRPVVKVNNILKQPRAMTGISDKPPISPPYQSDCSKSSTLPKFRSHRSEVAMQPAVISPVSNSGLFQRRKVSMPVLNTTKPQPAATSSPNTTFLRSQSMKNLPSDRPGRENSTAQSLPWRFQDLKASQRQKVTLQHQLQPVHEPPCHQTSHASTSLQPSQKHFHRSQPQVNNTNGAPPLRLTAEAKALHDAKLSAVNDILGDLEQLNTLIDKQTPPVTLRRFPRAVSQTSLTSNETSFSDTCTVDDVLNNVSPELTLKPIKPLTARNLQRMSDYDNLLSPRTGGTPSRRTVVSSVATQYCAPWDSNLLQDLVTLGSVAQQGKFPSTSRLLDKEQMNRDSYLSRQSALTDYSFCNESESGRAHSEISHDLVPCQEVSLCHLSPGAAPHISDDEGVEEDANIGQVGPHPGTELASSPSRHRPVPSNVIGKNKNFPGIKVRDYVTELAENLTTTFGKSVDHFICCTKEGNESNPHVVVRNIRQFMNGIKNYLCQNGEGDLNKIIQQERSNLGEAEFLNIDALLEGSLHKCVVKPLERHLVGLFIEEYRRTGALQQMKDNIEYARTKSPYELGIKPEMSPPETHSMEKVKSSLHRMQKAYSPLKKLQHLLTATADIYTLIQEMEDSETESSTNSTASLGADDFLPMFIYILVQCGMVSAEIEAEYMWGLLQPSILAGEGGYHLTILSSAVHVLKQLRATMDNTDNSPRLPSLGDLQGFMKIIIPDERNHSIITKILPVRPNMTARDVCNMIAHRFKVSNPQDHGLYLLISGFSTAEERLTDTDCPQNMKENILKDGRECVFAYKRINAKFVWPVIFKS